MKKKITGWFIILFCSIVLFIMAIAFLSFLYDFSQDTTKDNVTTFAGFVIPIMVSCFALNYGLGLVRKEKIIERIAYEKQLTIEVTGKIEFKSYRNLVLQLTYKKNMYAGVLLALIAYSVMFFYNKTNVNSTTLIIFICIWFAFVLVPVVTIFQIRKLYDTNKIFQEKLTYILNNDSIQVIGETVNSIQKWTHFFKVKETEKFFLFYYGESIAILLEKKMFQQIELAEFSEFIKSLNLIKE